MVACRQRRGLFAWAAAREHQERGENEASATDDSTAPSVLLPIHAPQGSDYRVVTPVSFVTDAPREEPPW